MVAPPDDAPDLDALLPSGDFGSKDAVARAREAWGVHARSRAREVTTGPSALDHVTAEAFGVTVVVHGVIHGIVGGDSADYKAFVDADLAQCGSVVLENGLGYFYRHPDAETMPDFAVLGVAGSFAVGLWTGLRLPLLLWDLLREVLKRGASGDDVVHYDRRYHALDPEVRRGLDSPAVLPSRFEVPIILEQWRRRGFFAGLFDPFACVPRSVFMAGYAVGCAERRGLSRVDLVVGDLHATEVAYVLRTVALHEHPQFVWGRALARRGGGARRGIALLLKVRHLALGGAAGSLVLLPVIYSVMTLIG